MKLEVKTAIMRPILYSSCKRGLLLVILLYSSTTSFSQKYALIDKYLNIPIVYTDSVTVEQVSKGFFPVLNSGIDSFIANIVYISEVLHSNKRSKMDAFELKSGLTTIEVQVQHLAYGDGYNIVAKTRAGNIDAKYTFSTTLKPGKGRAVWAKQMDKFIAYLKSNKDFYKERKDLKPEIYNIQIVTN